MDSTAFTRPGHLDRIRAACYGVIQSRPRLHPAGAGRALKTPTKTCTVCAGARVSSRPFRGGLAGVGPVPSAWRPGRPPGPPPAWVVLLPQLRADRYSPRFSGLAPACRRAQPLAGGSAFHCLGTPATAWVHTQTLVLPRGPAGWIFPRCSQVVPQRGPKPPAAALLLPWPSWGACPDGPPLVHSQQHARGGPAVRDMVRD